MIKFLKHLRKNQSEISSLAREYYLGSKVNAKGELKCESDIYIDCKYQGTVNTKGLVEIDVNANFSGELSARAIIVKGKIKNTKIFARQTVTVSSGASISGSIECEEISIQQGAIVRASITSQGVQ